MSCNNHDKTDHNVQSKEDSVRRADSVKAENDARTEREQYQNKLNARIDSLKARIHEQDSIFSKRNERERQRWQANRERINARIERLRQQKESANAVAKDKWNNFKLSVDTAMTNLKNDWNKTLEKMKAK
jgi:hypothetical protein